MLWQKFQQLTVMGAGGGIPQYCYAFFAKKIYLGIREGECLLNGNNPQSSILRPPIVDETLLTVTIHHDWEKKQNCTKIQVKLLNQIVTM